MGWLALLVVLAVAGAFGQVARADAEAGPAGAEVRLGARVSDDGAIRIGLQWREEGRWRGVTPRLSVIPGDAEVGRWYVSSSVSVPVRRVEVEVRVEDEEWIWEYSPGVLIVAVGEREWRDECGHLRLRLDGSTLGVNARKDCEEWSYEPIATDIGAEPNGETAQLVRVLAQQRTEGGVDLGLQRLIDGEWQAMEPSSPTSLTLDSSGRWAFTESFALPLSPPIVAGELRPGATISTDLGRLQVEVDGEVKQARCDWLAVITSIRSVQIRSATEDCQEVEPLFSVCAAESLSHCDHQQFQTYHWESAHDYPAWISLSQEDIPRIVEAVFLDFVTDLGVPEVIVSDWQGASYGSKNTIAILPEHRLLDVVLHETTHAIVDALGFRHVGHGPIYAATYVEVLGRYAPLVDTRVMRASAERMGVSIADRGARPVSDDGIEVVREIVCGLGEPGQAMCDAFRDRATFIVDAEVEQQKLGGGWTGDIAWGNVIQDDGRLWTSVTAFALIGGQSEAEARLQVVCDAGTKWIVRLWWPQEAALAEAVEYRAGSQKWSQDYWSLRLRVWEGSDPQYLAARVPATILSGMFWASSAGQPWLIRVADDERTYDVAFDLAGMFNTPVQADLAACGLHQPAGDPNAPILAQGEVNERLRYQAFVTDDDILLTHVVLESPIAELPDSVALLNIRCHEDDLSVQVWWQIDRNLSSSVQLQFGDHDPVRESWRHHKGTFRIQGVETTLRSQPAEAEALLKDLTWASAFGAAFTVQARSGGETYTAGFGLEGLFGTPVQGNLAACGG